MASRPWPADHKPRKDVPVRGGETQEETDRNLAALVTSPELAAYRIIADAEMARRNGAIAVTPALPRTDGPAGPMALAAPRRPPQRPPGEMRDAQPH